MTESMDPNAFLMGGGLKGFSFEHIGTTATGVIARPPTVRQQTDPSDQSPKTFKNGDPMNQLVVAVNTNLRETPDDDGVRAFYIKSNMLVAVREAVRKTGAPGLEVGGTLTVTYVGDGEKKAAGLNAPKLFTAVYQRPSSDPAANHVLMSNDNGNGGQPPPPQQQQQQQPVYQQPPPAQMAPPPPAYQQPQPPAYQQPQPPAYQQPAYQQPPAYQPPPAYQQQPAQTYPQPTQTYQQQLPEGWPGGGQSTTTTTPPEGVSPEVWQRLSPEQQQKATALQAR